MSSDVSAARDARTGLPTGRSFRFIRSSPWTEASVWLRPKMNRRFSSALPQKRKAKVRVDEPGFRVDQTELWSMALEVIRLPDEP